MLSKFLGSFTAGTLLILMTASALFAQDAAPYCAQLEATDCALLTTSAEVMQDIHSVETESTLLFNLADIPEMPFEELSFRYDQRSAFSIDPEAMTLFKEIQKMSPLEMEAMMSNPLDAIDFIETILTSMNLAVEMDLALSDEVLALLNEEVHAELGVDLPADLGLQLRFIDGIVYLDMTTIAAMVPEIGMFVQGWVGVDSAPLLQLARDEMAKAGIDESFQTPSSSALDNNPFAAISTNQSSGPLVTVVDQMDPTGEATTYMNIERTAPENDQADDQADIATFRTTLDYDKFMKSNAFRELVYAIMTENGNSGAAVTAAQLDETVTLAQIMAPAFLQDLNLALIEQIDESNGYMVGGELDLDWDLKSILTLAAQSDPSMKLAPGASPNLKLNSSATNSSINEDISIEAPEGAFVVPMEMLMMFMNS